MLNSIVIKEVAESIVSFLVDRTGNEIFDNIAEKRKITKILKDDKKKIKNTFCYADSSTYSLIETFLFSMFREPDFYSSLRLSMEQEAKLWDEFRYYLNKETGDNYISHDYREKLIKCMNLHNDSINNIIMDSKSRIQARAMQRQHDTIENSLNNIINTLNTRTILQENQDELDFLIEQLESIIKSYRYDINKIRRIQLFCFCVALVFLLICTITIYWKSANMTLLLLSYPLLGIIMINLLFITILKYTTARLNRLEDKLDFCSEFLWRIHSNIYRKYLNRKFDISEDIKFEKDD